MKRNFPVARLLLAVLTMVTLLALPAGAAKTKKEKIDSVKGEVVDLACYLADKNKKGEAHAACARECMNAGNPVGILTSDGKLYLALGKDMKPVNDQLVPYAAKQVRVKGKKCVRGNMAAIIVESIEELPPPKSRAKPKRS